jgi:hypothetical protein
MAVRCWWTVCGVPGVALNVGGDGERLNGVEVEPTPLTPGKEAANRLHVGPTRVPVPDGGGEELKEAFGSAWALAGDDRRREGLAGDVRRRVLGYQQLGSGHAGLYNIKESDEAAGRHPRGAIMTPHNYTR